MLSTQHTEILYDVEVKSYKVLNDERLSMKALELTLFSVYEFSQLKMSGNRIKKKILLRILGLIFIRVSWNVIVSLESHKAIKFHFIDMNRKPY